jgi:ABC-type nitrate/sulfonate/bicarbonate transport system substrate-binding protein
MPGSMDRRTFLRRGIGFVGGASLLGIGGTTLLEGCQSRRSKASNNGSGHAPGLGAANFGVLNLYLPWVPTVESGGEFLAESKGYYVQQGFSSVNLIPGGNNKLPGESVVETGGALVAVTLPDSTAAAIEKGFGLKCIGAEYQKNPFCIMSRADKPVHTPQDMVGKIIGVQSLNEPIWSAFLKANLIDPAMINKVEVGFDPAPLAQGQVDGWFSFVTNEPIHLALQGVETQTFLLADYHYPEVGNVFITTVDSLKNARPQLKAAMTAEVIAWRECIANPSEPAIVTMEKYGRGLVLQAQEQQSVAQSKLMATADALTHGLFYVSTDAQQANIRTLGIAGTHLTASQLFDMSILDEIYQARPDLKSVPTPGTI